MSWRGVILGAIAGCAVSIGVVIAVEELQTRRMFRTLDRDLASV